MLMLLMLMLVVVLVLVLVVIMLLMVMLLMVGRPSAAAAVASCLQVSLEEGFPPELVDKLRAKGHVIKPDQARFTRAEMFGRGQIITRDPVTGVLCGGSDPRADGLAIGFC